MIVVANMRIPSRIKSYRGIRANVIDLINNLDLPSYAIIACMVYTLVCAMVVGDMGRASVAK